MPTCYRGISRGPFSMSIKQTKTKKQVCKSRGQKDNRLSTLQNHWNSIADYQSQPQMSHISRIMWTQNHSAFSSHDMLPEPIIEVNPGPPTIPNHLEVWSSYMYGNLLTFLLLQWLTQWPNRTKSSFYTEPTCQHLRLSLVSINTNTALYFSPNLISSQPSQ